MPVQRNQVHPGTELVGRYKGVTFTAEVLLGEGDRLRYRLPDGREFRSPSGAGRAVMGGVACNGWRFWSAVTAPDRAATSPDSGPAGCHPAQEATL